MIGLGRMGANVETHLMIQQPERFIETFVRAGADHVILEVDGGIDAETVPKVIEAGARVLVAGRSIFARPGGPEAGIGSLLRAVC